MITEGRDLPWLQDVVEEDVWVSWAVTYRDIYIVDGEGILVDVFNATDQDLTDAGNLADFQARLMAAVP